MSEQRLEPGDKLSIAKHDYQIAYEPARLGAVEAVDEKAPQENIFGRSLLESAGLETHRPGATSAPPSKPRPSSP